MHVGNTAEALYLSSTVSVAMILIPEVVLEELYSIRFCNVIQEVFVLVLYDIGLPTDDAKSTAVHIDWLSSSCSLVARMPCVCTPNHVTPMPLVTHTAVV